jgi:hypothetical protein
MTNLLAGMDLPAVLFELELRIALLPSLSRGAHLDGPAFYARQLADLWKVNGNDDIPLAQAFRLLNVEAITEAIYQTLAVQDYPGDSRQWTFPALEGLLPELRALTWRAMLSGTLITEAIKGVTGKRHRAVLSAELPRLTPDWGLSRLIRDGRDEFIAVRVRRVPAEPIKKTWKDKPTQVEVDAAMVEIAKGYPPAQEYPPDAPRPSFDDIWEALKGRCGAVTRRQARDALDNRASHLRGQPGYRSTKSPS